VKILRGLQIELPGSGTWRIGAIDPNLLKRKPQSGQSMLLQQQLKLINWY
jgi:hypothetical protein